MKYEIEELKKGDLKKTLGLVKKVFDEHEAKVYGKEGTNNFYKFIDYDNIKKELDNNMEIIVAKKNEDIIGMIGMKNKQHISMLFVDSDYHKQGVGTSLFKYAMFYCTYKEPTKRITVNSAPSAVGFYKKLDFRDISEEQLVDGIRFTPMEYIVR